MKKQTILHSVSRLLLIAAITLSLTTACWTNPNPDPAAPTPTPEVEIQPFDFDHPNDRPLIEP